MHVLCTVIFFFDQLSFSFTLYIFGYITDIDGLYNSLLHLGFLKSNLRPLALFTGTLHLCTRTPTILHVHTIADLV